MQPTKSQLPSEETSNFSKLFKQSAGQPDHFHKQG